MSKLMDVVEDGLISYKNGDVDLEQARDMIMWVAREQLDNAIKEVSEVKSKCKNCGKLYSEHILGKVDFKVIPKWCNENENSKEFVKKDNQENEEGNSK